MAPRRQRSVPPAPDEASLRAAAFAYLARYASTEAGLRRVLLRRVDRWARQAPDSGEAAAAARTAVPAIVARCVELSLLNDAAYAAGRAKTLALAGQSRRGVAAHLIAKGIDAQAARAAAPEDELISALILTRKRRIGPFRTAVMADRAKELGVLARAGFPRAIAVRALETDPAEAEERIRAARA